MVRHKVKNGGFFLDRDSLSDPAYIGTLLSFLEIHNVTENIRLRERFVSKISHLALLKIIVQKHSPLVSLPLFSTV